MDKIEIWQLIGMFIGGGALTALITTFGTLLLEKFKHKHEQQIKAQDKQDTLEKVKESIVCSIEKLQNTTDEQFLALTDQNRVQDIKIDAINSTVQIIVTNELARTYIDLRRKALLAIKEGKIKEITKLRLASDYDRYLSLPGATKDLEPIMAAVSSLQVIFEDNDTTEEMKFS